MTEARWPSRSCSSVCRWHCPTCCRSFQHVRCCRGGPLCGSTALGAVGSTSTFVTLFTGFLIGLSNGVNVLVARYYGARHPKDVSKTVHSALVVSLLAGILLLAVGLFGSPALLRLLNTKEDLLPGCDPLPACLFSGHAGAGALQLRQCGVQRHRRDKKPLAYLSVAGVVNILLNLFLSSSASWMWPVSRLPVRLPSAFRPGSILHALTKVEDCYALDLHSIRLDLGTTKRILMLGIPAGLQNAIFAIANLFIQAGVNSFDSPDGQGQLGRRQLRCDDL